MNNNLCVLGKHSYSNGKTELEYFRDFSWDCGWYWGGGYVGNKTLHHHFNGLHNGKNLDLVDAFNEYYDETKLTTNQLWRLCDLMKQFYSYKESARCFAHGGHYCSDGQNENEINKDLAETLNNHLKDVIIPEVRRLLLNVDKQEWRSTK